MNLFMILLSHLALAFLGTAHPGDHEERSATDNKLQVQKRTYHSNFVQSYNECAKNLESSGLNKRATFRRRSKINQFRQEIAALRLEQQTFGPHRKPNNEPTLKHIFNLPDQLEKSHLVTNTSIGPDTPPDELFGNNGTCVLNPNSSTGPFYIKGELIRSNITEGEAGVPMIIDTQIIDVDSCDPLEGVWWDIWSCNATGVYSGIQTWGNGDENDASNLNATFLRGLQQSDSEGVAQFQAIFPGHYLGRATHLHVVAHVGNVTRLSNDTISGGSVAHRAVDWIFLEGIKDTSSDPFFNYVKLGDDIEEGIFAWVSIAVNLSVSFDPSHEWRLTDHGDVHEPESGGIDI
ncbi:hypothetical protein N7478_009652 [Penicillium angulare]|uniref:uncharacterized protein n=1 Tax=Penicillium angulare TaxID=116970 RepID=UPI0025425CDA|nr:uncharacterized protein N7478_009652 [Penicillium angulare]KAJ5266844.1 hypothetical protein N7478_009652 [Penicillium angulare]